MVIRKGNDNGRSIRRVGPVLGSIQEDEKTGESVQALQEATAEGGAAGGAGGDAAYNRTEEGDELLFAGKMSGRRKLRDIDVVRLRRNEERLTLHAWGRIYQCSHEVIWKAMKGLTYKHLNWRYPPLR